MLGLRVPHCLIVNGSSSVVLLQDRILSSDPFLMHKRRLRRVKESLPTRGWAPVGSLSCLEEGSPLKTSSMVSVGIGFGHSGIR